STPEKRAWWDEVKRAAENPPRLNMEDGPMTARDGILSDDELERIYEDFLRGLHAIEAAITEADYRMLLDAGYFTAWPQQLRGKRDGRREGRNDRRMPAPPSREEGQDTVS